jgi:hypothetical protein
MKKQEQCNKEIATKAMKKQEQCNKETAAM